MLVFIGSEISDNSVLRLLKKRKIAKSVDKSPFLLITQSRFISFRPVPALFVLLFSLQIYVIILK